MSDWVSNMNKEREGMHRTTAAALSIHFSRKATVFARFLRRCLAKMCTQDSVGARPRYFRSATQAGGNFESATLLSISINLNSHSNEGGLPLLHIIFTQCTTRYGSLSRVRDAKHQQPRTRRMAG
eukprot:gnl/TRDRNA2_/TRDRNA2_145204_c0_seq1.p1 gnl/TRDRNA2_/TRDRNA2_145204_c0~~gnl/TRDRNA2_/TRDRNA2_145204_c0_seq1.p1  ORF type:complete len:125 (-),score=0.21 gnl/TRDRNA2_/TRDRNA2_145204_c0_seq1:162-536(-)